MNNFLALMKGDKNLKNVWEIVKKNFLQVKIFYLRESSMVCALKIGHLRNNGLLIHSFE